MTTTFGFWTWWSTLILLLLRFTYGDDDMDTLNITSITDAPPTTTTPSGPASADKLGVPRCESNYDCVHNGLCRKDTDGYGRCLCPRSCPPYIPMDCMKQGTSSYYRLRQRYRHELPCGVMDSNYAKKYDLPSPQCHLAKFFALAERIRDVTGRCSCPPMFDNWKTSDSPVLNLLPTKCDRLRRRLGECETAPSWSVARRRSAEHCGVAMTEFEKMNTPYCWELEIRNVQLSDSGSYMCHVNANQQPSVNYTIEFQVKAPRTIQNLTIVTNDNSANVSWDVQQGPQLKIGLRLVRRTGLNGQEVFSQMNAISPVTITNLRAATPYKLFVTVNDSQTDPFEITELFNTAESKPHPPKYEDVRVLNSGSSLICEVEWRAPALTNGRISRYYVRVQGAVRRMRPGGPLVADDFPPPTDEEKCANWDEREDASHGINPIEFTTEFLSCKYGPLKPNRNYTITVWAENSAGRSSPLVFPKHCITNYAQPDVVEKPITSTNSNHTSFNLAFNSKPDDTNGPISCYYIGIVPLLKNVSLEILPPPQEIVMDTVSKAFNNNLHPLAAEKKRFFAYIAESYTDYPMDTVIGDGRGVAGMKPCSVLYLSRYKAEDVVLRPGLKYTGFLIVRVDKDDKEEVQGGAQYSRVLDPLRPRSYRQLHLSGPAYGFSGYFKPVFLEPEDEGSVLGTFFTVLVPLLVFLTMASVLALFVLHKRGEVSQWCHWLWMSKDSSVGAERTLLRPSAYHAIAVDDLPSEYLMRHRDSDFLFAQEYEALPHYKLDATASAKKENACKNRYNDIRAFDATRVKLRVINEDENSDYINANFVKGWDDRKTFIAAQAPLDTTISDFWRMIWEQDARLIVMVANLFEKNRQQCTKYWPDDQATRYGDLLISPREASYFADYAIRCFDMEPTNERFNRMSPGARSDVGSVESTPGSEYANVPSVRHSNGHAETSFVGTGTSRRVVQYHFTNWNDYKAPECSTGLLRFLNRLRELPEFNEYPVVIHCSAGVGRTGTFIAIDSMLDQCAAQGKADIFNFVAGLRKQRNLMVQSQEQYVFIYKALAEWHLFGYTDMDVEQLKEHYQALIDPGMSGSTKLVGRSDAAPATGMEAEFLKLERTLETPAKCSFAAKEENVMKNRFDSAVPYDRNRIVLRASIGYADTTYINASSLKGYFYPYVLAQDPVSENTVFDFWRMISELNVTTLVMLSNEEDWSPSEKYWPSELHDTAVYERPPYHVTVQLTGEEHFPYFITRKLSYRMKEDTVARSVVQFAFTAWPSSCVVPTSSEPLLSLVGRVLERQSGLPDSGPIVLHCRNGSSETGVYCCISLLLERLKAEQRIDVFQTVKGLQNQRPLIFSKLEHYAFCYQAVIDYIRSSR
ncbi:Protein-tyrosine phosphatase [Ancylostoma ceylanicum]|uniref:protein-tyrosine-phosphatase n=1 Tax=Ancylostoma ceylanicum TaxID=53326 RepID=A0A0D6LQ37_9BILA|nr:Protein-tyrosine phosphatase [Ancylostoma ceylanicum]